MRNFIPAVAVLLSVTILVNSCAVSKNSIAPQKSEVKNVNEASASCFIELNDGSIKQFTTLKLVTGILATPHLLGDGTTVINSKDIIAYQNDKHYAVSAKILTSTKSATVSAETLPGFAVKVVSGKLNVYCRKFYNGANTSNEYFLQNGSDGYIVAYSKDVLKSMLKYDINATAFFNSKTKISPTSKKMLAAVEIYNKGEMMTKN
ncbi:MAG: hypothetical protein LH615_02045 [Ferruginibacter sp.]|nr:hypothetical protein [Ferruginibacter sp.]